MAAGLGFKDFQTGEVLTAADVDGYLMQGIWVFADATARDAAVTSPQEGNFAFLKDTNVTTYYTGSAWTNLDTTGMVNPMTTTGDTIYSSSGSTPARLGIGTAGQVLQVNSGATAPEWATPAGGGGKVLQVVTANTNTLTSVASTSFTDSGLSLSITPSAATSKVLILISQSTQVTHYNPSGATTTPFGTIRLVRTSTEITSNIMQGYFAKASDSEAALIVTNSFSYLDSPNTTSATTYKTQGKVNSTANSGQINFQRTSDGYSTITLLEIGA
jgi:hypothetical protein